jgi:hypothetical protein
MDVLNAEYNAMTRSKFDEIKLNHVNIFGAKTIQVAANELAIRKDYIDLKSSPDKAKTKLMEDQ